MSKENCWEYMECGSEKDCPAYPYAGRLCFGTPKTLCKGEIQGGYADKAEGCRECDFYNKVLFPNRKK